MKNILKGMPSVSHDPKNELYEDHSYQLRNHYYKLSHLKPNEIAVGHVYPIGMVFYAEELKHETYRGDLSVKTKLFGKAK
ncbi:hypothetical protein [Peribacillus simplex]|uniref:hypothetical protein n=1 Tax=Peribacillus simplex TaxID=1478 RepID=UPI00097076D6|nr:hypothetical protein [Peribacillus simplex]